MRFKAIIKAIIWKRMVVKLGTEQNAMDALRDKDIFAATDLHDNTKRLYIMKEHINEEAWTSANILSGMQTMEAAPGIEHRAHVNAMIEDWFAHHEDGWSAVMDWCEEAAPMPATVPMEPLPVPMPATAPMPAAAPTDPNYNAGPTPEAKVGASIKRMLGHLCSIKSRPVSVPVLYQYQYQYQY